ncbi:MAG: hypothetical protein Q9181_006681 [Wetmoreana brouardii]
MKLIILTLISLASAHFTLDYPQVRGFDEDNLGTFPCGGQDTISSNLQVLLALGNDVTDGFSTVLVPTTQEQGLGKFCLSDVKIPEGLGAKEGDNATIQVVTNGDPSGGLYNCADITFSATNTSAQECTNGKGVSTTKYTGKSANANGTDSTAASSTMSMGSSSATGTPSATGSATAASTTGAAGKMELGGVALLAAFVALVL